MPSSGGGVHPIAYVRITPEAKELILAAFVREQLTRPGLMIHRQGPVGEVTRTSAGDAKWRVERPHPWRAQVLEIGDHHDDIVLVEGVLVWLPLIPRKGELGVQVSARNGELYVEALAT